MDRPLNIFLRNDFLFWFSSSGRRQRKCLKVLHGFSDQVIASKRIELANQVDINQNEETANETGEKRKLAFLDMLLQSTIDGQRLSDTDIREEVDTFMFAGHDTSELEISFCLYNLAKNPDIQQKVFEEAKVVIGDANRKLSQKDFNDLKYLDQVLKESLRLYPPAPFFGRKVHEEFEMSE